MKPEIRKMFLMVERLLRILLTSPASSCSAERSFSALRRLKTYLRSSMSQSRLNHIIACNVHHELLNKHPDKFYAEQFINSESRMRIFGSFT